MLQILPLSSPLHPAESVQQIINKLSKQHFVPSTSAFQLWHPGMKIDAAYNFALLIVTGGTENQALQLLTQGQMPDGQVLATEASVKFSDPREPVLLLAHPLHNSLPAAMEILAKLRQLNRRGKIIFLSEQQQFCAELQQVEKIISTKQRLKRLRLGQLGNPSDWLIASMPPAQLVSEQWGPHLVAVEMAEISQAIALADEEQAKNISQSLLARAQGCVEPTAADLQLAAKVVIGLKEIVKRHRLDALTIRCFDLVTSLQTTGCLAVSQLIDEGIIAGCEGDIPAALTMVWLNLLTGELPFMANPQEIDAATNSLWLAHCTIGTKIVENFRLRSHFESSCGVAFAGTVALGDVTIARLGGLDLRQLFVSDGQLTQCEFLTGRCRTQLKIKLARDTQLLLRQPLGNHHVLIKGHFAPLLEEYHQLFGGSLVSAISS